MNVLKLLISIVISIGIIVFTYWINNINIHKNIKKVINIIAIVGYAGFQVVWIQKSLLKPGADSGMIYGTAKLLFNNQDIMKEHILSYFAYYKQNIGLVVIYEKLMKLFQTDNLNLFRYLNVVCNVFMVLGLNWIYKMLENGKKEKNGLLFYILILGFLPISLLSTWVYGDFIGLSLSIWSIAFIMKYQQNKKIQYFIFSSICMAIAIMARSNSNIFIIAIAMYLLFTISQEKTSKEKIIKLLIMCLFILISIMPNKILTNYVSNKYQLNNRKEKSFITYLYMGVSEGKMANGWYNDEINDINNEMKKHPKDDKTIENQTKEKLKERVKYLLRNPGYCINFYKYKVLSMWAEPTMASEVYNSQRDVDMSGNKLLVKLFEEKNFEILRLSQKIINYIIFVGALICVILKRKKMSNEMLLLVLVFLGGFSFHILWEAKSRYIIPYVVILIPVAISGITELSEKLKTKEKKIKMLKEGEKNTKRGVI